MLTDLNIIQTADNFIFNFFIFSSTCKQLYFKVQALKVLPVLPVCCSGGCYFFQSLLTFFCEYRGAHLHILCDLLHLRCFHFIPIWNFQPIHLKRAPWFLFNKMCDNQNWSVLYHWCQLVLKIGPQTRLWTISSVFNCVNFKLHNM